MTDDARMHALRETMDAIVERATYLTHDEPTYDGRNAIAAAYIQGAAALHAAEIQAHALDRLSARLAPSIESLTEMLGLALDE
jgi:hypothetical protein